MSEKFKRKLTVTECKSVYTGTSANTGREYTIYEVAALSEGGEPLDIKFKTFSELSIGELVEYDVETRTTDKYGTEYTLSIPGQRGGGGGGGLGKSVDELRSRIEAIEAKLGMGSDIPVDPSDFQVTPPAKTPESIAAARDAGTADVDDIPF